MKKLLIAAAFLALVGFGCAKSPASTATVVPADFVNSYENSQFGISFAFPAGVEMRQREEENRPQKYLGIDVDFFASLRNVVRDEKATNLAFFYAAPKLSTDAFVTALEATNADGAVKVTSTEDVTINGIPMKKITSTTEMGTDKVHYLFDAKDSTIIVSRFIYEEGEFEPIFATITVK